MSATDLARNDDNDDDDEEYNDDDDDDDNNNYLANPTVNLNQIRCKPYSSNVPTKDTKN